MGTTRHCCLPVYNLAAFFSLAIIIVSAGCGGGSPSSPGGSQTAKTLTSISVSPGAADISAGTTQQFQATAKYSDGSTADVSSTVAWSDASQSIATISSTGLAKGMASGSTAVTATLSGMSGSATLTVTTVAPAVTSIAVSPSSAGIAVGATAQFTATATYSDGSTGIVSTTAAWSSSAPLIATVNSSGLASGLASGSATITAMLSGVAGTATLSVKTVTSIAVSPPTASILAGSTQQFAATATYNDGSTVNVSTTAAWTSSVTTVATIGSSGLATGVTAGSTVVTASIGGISGTATLTVTPRTVTSLSVTPSTSTVLTGATEQLTATATYSDGSTANVSTTATWMSANQSVATVNSIGIATGVASGSTTITASLSGFNASATVTVSASVGTNVPLWHFDAQRSGLNSTETLLTTSNVTATTFGKLFSYLVDGYVYGQPLLMSNVTINGSSHNVLYVATENDSVYAFDADTYGSGAPLWQVSLLQTGETPITNGPIQPYTGITSTPAIDTTTNTMYVVSTQTSSASGGTFRVNALDITTGAQRSGSPVTIQVSMSGANAGALTTSCLQRAALLVNNGFVYIGFASCKSGWLLAYNEQNLSAAPAVFNSSPNLPGEGAFASAGGVWMSGGGPAADSLGNIYITTGNGPWDGQTAWSDSVLKFRPNLTLEDYFTPYDYQYMDCADADLASGGLLLIPGTTQALAGGKTGKLYLVDTTNLGHETSGDTGATQWLWFEENLSPPYQTTCTDSTVNTTYINAYEIFGTAAFFNNSVYLGITPTSTTTPAGVGQFTYSGTLTPVAYTMPSILENSRGTTPFISANGITNGILWMIDHGQPLQTGSTQTSATLRAYDAANLAGPELYDSGQNTGDTPGYGIKFTSPIVANGKVYITSGHDDVTVPNPRGEVDVYGLKQ
ncbi:MAG TPA: Ig-like domain-containing protein [Candidatus Sulfotelmatobacter sp.]